MIERKKSISSRYINENKSEIKTIVGKVSEIYRKLVFLIFFISDKNKNFDFEHFYSNNLKIISKEENSSLNEIAKTRSNLKGLPEIIAASNREIG